MTLDNLRELMESKQFHHATYRNHGTLHEGLWVYVNAANGFRGYDVAGAFLAGSPDLDAAFELCRGTGISVGAYGQG